MTPMSGHNHNTKINNKSFASEVEGSRLTQWSTPWEWQISLKQKPVEQRKKGTTMVKKKERWQGSRATAQRISRRRLLSPNIAEIWKAATAPAITSDTLVNSHMDTLFGGLFYDAVSTTSVDNRITVGWRIGKDLEGSDCGLIEILPLDLLEEKNHEKYRL